MQQFEHDLAPSADESPVRGRRRAFRAEFSTLELLTTWEFAISTDAVRGQSVKTGTSCLACRDDRQDKTRGILRIMP